MTSFLSMTLGASVLIVITALLRLCFLHKLPKRMFTVLWAVAMLRLLVPLSVPVSVSVPAPLAEPVWRESEMATLSTEARNSTAQSDLPLPSTATAAESPPDIPTLMTEAEPAASDAVSFAPQPPLRLTSRQIAGALWAAGALGLLALFLVRHVRWRQRYREAVPAEDPVIDDILRDTGCRRKVMVKLCQSVPGPLTYGLFRPVILLPKIDYSDRSTLGYILAHELTHIRRLHVLYKGGLVLSLCLHWFNPLVWLLYILANRDLELSCDEAVLQKNRDTRKGYALTLLSLEEARALPPLISGFAARAVEERIRSIMKFKKFRIISLVLAFVLVLSSTGVFAAFELTPAGPVELVMYTDYSGGISQIIRDFNREHEDYHITIIHSPSIPLEPTADILAYSMSTLSQAETENLIPYLEADGKLTTESIIPSLYTALTESGSLNCIPTSFQIDAFSTSGDIIGDRAYLPPEEALSYAYSLGNGIVFNRMYSAESTLAHLAESSSLYIDLASRTCSFDTGAFAESLKLCATTPGVGENANAGLLTWQSISGFSRIYYAPGDRLVGFPTNEGSSTFFSTPVTGLCLAIGADSKHKDIAWEFIKFAIQDTYQTKQREGFPVTVSAFSYLLKNSGEAKALSENQRAELWSLLENTTEFWTGDDRVYDIVYGYGMSYLLGQLTAEEAAKEIQLRVTEYLWPEEATSAAPPIQLVEGISADVAIYHVNSGIPESIPEEITIQHDANIQPENSDHPRGDIAPGDAMTFDAQPMAPGQTVTLSAAYTQNDFALQIGVERPDGTVSYSTISGGAGTYTYAVTEDGTHAIWVCNPSEVNIDFVMSYIVT